MFFRACRHHSAKSAKWGGGHLIPFATATAPPPGSAACDSAADDADRVVFETEASGGGVRQVVSPTLPFPLSLPLSIPLHPFLTSGREGQIQ